MNIPAMTTRGELAIIAILGLATMIESFMTPGLQICASLAGGYMFGYGGVRLIFTS